MEPAPVSGGGGIRVYFSGWPVPGLVVFGALPSSTLPSLRRSRPSCAFRWLSGDLPCSLISSLTNPAPSLISPFTLISVSLLLRFATVIRVQEGNALRANL